MAAIDNLEANVAGLVEAVDRVEVKVDELRAGTPQDEARVQAAADLVAEQSTRLDAIIADPQP